jgi:hypothetical protein
MQLIFFFNTGNSQLPDIRASRIVTQLAEISKKICHACKVFQKQIVMCVCSPTTVVLPVPTSSTTCHSSSCRCYVSRSWLNLWLLCNMLIHIQNLFAHQSCMIPRKTPVQELMQKHVLLALCYVSITFSHAANRLV